MAKTLNFLFDFLGVGWDQGKRKEEQIFYILVSSFNIQTINKGHHTYLNILNIHFGIIESKAI